MKKEREDEMIGERVRTYRKAKKLSLSELANRAGVSKSYLSSLERDLQTNPSIQFLEKISRVLDVPVDEFLNKGADTESQLIQHLDSEWQQLVKEAMNSGISKEQFKEFLEYNKWRQNQPKE